MRLALVLSVVSLFAPGLTAQGNPTLMLDARDGKGLSLPVDVERAPDGTLFVASSTSDNVLRRLPDGTTDIWLPSTGNGFGQALIDPYDLQLDSQGRLYVSGDTSDNLFRVDADGTIHVILDSTGVGGQPLNGARTLAIDSADNVFLADLTTVYKITPDGTASVFIADTGIPGGTLPLTSPRVLAGQGGDVYVTSDNFFALTTDGVLHIPDGGAPVELFTAFAMDPWLIDFDGAGNLYVLGRLGLLYRITPAGTGTLLVDALLNGTLAPISLAVRDDGTCWFTGTQTVQFQNFSLLLEVSPTGTPTPLPIISTQPIGHAFLDSQDNLYYETIDCMWMQRTPGGDVKLFADLSGSGLSSCRGVTPEPDDGFLVWHNTGIQRVAPDATVTQLLEGTGNGNQFLYDQPENIAVHADGTLYAITRTYDRVLRVDGTTGKVTTILDATGDGLGNVLNNPTDVVVAEDHTAWVVGDISNNVFRIDPDGTVTQVLDTTGDGTTTFEGGEALALDSQGNVYASGWISDTVFKITPAGAVSLFLDTSGAVPGLPQGGAYDLEVDGFDNLYAAIAPARVVLRVSPTGVTTEMINESGDGLGNTLSWPERISVGQDGTLFVLDISKSFVFRVRPNGDTTLILDPTGDGVHPAQAIKDVAVDRFGSAWVTDRPSHSVFRIDSGDQIVHVFEQPPGGNPVYLHWPSFVGVDGDDRAYVVGDGSNNVWRFDGPPLWTDLGGAVTAAGGQPELRMRGPLTAGSALDRTLDNVPPSTLLLVWISSTSAPFGFMDGTVHAFPFTLQLFFVSDPLGQSVLSAPWPAGQPSGLDLYLQFLVQDASVPGGIGLSNAVLSTTP